MNHTWTRKMDFWISYLVVLSVLFPTFAANCENMVRLADLQDIIKNQTKLIHNMVQVIEAQVKVNEEQKNLIENQAKSLQYQTLLYEDLQATVNHLKTGKRNTEITTVEFSLNGAKLSLNSVNSDHLRNH